MRALIRSFAERDFSGVCLLEQGEKGSYYPAAVFIRQASVLYPAMFFVAQYHQEIAGYGIGAVEGEAPGMAWILRLRVSPPHRRKHIGTDLLEALLQEFARRQVSLVRLSVAPGNTAALALYRKTGFTPAGFHKDYFGEDEDRIIMARESSTPPRAPSRVQDWEGGP